MEQHNVSPLNCVKHLMEQKNHKTYIFGVKNSRSTQWLLIVKMEYLAICYEFKADFFHFKTPTWH
jgi:hypothetical protein